MSESAHNVSYEPQPIADQWMVRCTCGWRETISAHDFADMRLEAFCRGEAHLKVNGTGSGETPIGFLTSP